MKNAIDIQSVNAEPSAEAGFSLIEVCVALIVIMIALLGVFVTFTYAINYNSGNKSRSEALAVLQQEVEQIRAAKYTPTITDPILQGGTKAPRMVTRQNGGVFGIRIDVDNDPFTNGIQDESVPTAYKEVTIRVQLEAPSPGWQSAVPATIVLRRVRAN